MICFKVFDHIMHNEIYDLSNESSATTELNPIIGVLTRENIFVNKFPLIFLEHKMK